MCSNPIETCTSSANVCGSMLTFVGSSKFMPVLHCTVAKKHIKEKDYILCMKAESLLSKNGLIICYVFFFSCCHRPLPFQGLHVLKGLCNFQLSCHSCQMDLCNKYQI